MALTAPFAIIYYGAIVGVIGTFIGIIIGCVQTKKTEKENNENCKLLELQDKENYKRAIEKYNYDCRKEKERLEEEGILYAQLLSEKYIRKATD